jgi:hypothetical protein
VVLLIYERVILGRISTVVSSQLSVVFDPSGVRGD